MEERHHHVQGLRQIRHHNNSPAKGRLNIITGSKDGAGPSLYCLGNKIMAVHMGPGNADKEGAPLHLAGIMLNAQNIYCFIAFYDCTWNQVSQFFHKFHKNMSS